MERFYFTKPNPLLSNSRTNSENFTAVFARWGDEIGLRLFRFEVQRRAVHAVALTGGLGAVREDVAEVGAALAADDLFADHAMGVVDLGVHDFVVGGGEEAGPTAAAVKLFL